MVQRQPGVRGPRSQAAWNPGSGHHFPGNVTLGISSVALKEISEAGIVQSIFFFKVKTRSLVRTTSLSSNPAV